MYRDKTRRKRDVNGGRSDDRPRAPRSNGGVSEIELQRAAVGVL
jgi:hypothetical protein